MNVSRAICDGCEFSKLRVVDTMSKKYDDYCSEQMIHNRVCGVSYTLDDEQPVICTHIGDQPLYYMDEEIIEDEEDTLDLEELGLMADEIRALKQEIAGFEVNVVHVPEETMQRHTEFAENIDSITGGASFELDEQEQGARLAEIIDVLGRSRLGAAYLNMAEKHDVDITLSAQVENAFYDRRAETILVYPHMDMQDQVLLLARELRRHWQHRMGALIHPLTFRPEHAILVNRAQEADRVVSMIRIAWELQLANYKDVWERVENSPLSDLARSFAREAFMDFRTINNGEAAAGVFESWFLSERCRYYDRVIIQAMLSDHQGYVFDNDQASSNVTLDLISKLGEMPFGKNYLAQHAAIIVDDPIFVEVRDRSNANFLWFIKFERSFKEAESDLCLDTKLSTGNDDPLDVGSDTQGELHGLSQKQSADIIQFVEFREYARSSQRGKVGVGQGCDVINIAQWAPVSS